MGFFGFLGFPRPLIPKFGNTGAHTVFVCTSKFRRFYSSSAQTTPKIGKIKCSQIDGNFKTTPKFSPSNVFVTCAKIPKFGRCSYPGENYS